MHVVADLSVIPVGTGASISTQVATCEKIIKESGLKSHLHAHGTNIEGPWAEVMATVERCHTVLHEEGAPRVLTAVRLATATDEEQSIQGRIDKVNQKT